MDGYRGADNARGNHVPSVFGSNEPADQRHRSPTGRPDPTAGDTATVRRIVAKLEAMPVEQARFVASAAYTIARAANADIDISDEETAVIEQALQGEERLDEATAVLVTEMAKLQAKTVGGTEDYVVTRELKKLATMEQRLDVLRACFAIGRPTDRSRPRRTAIVNEIASELDIDTAALNAVRDEYHEQLSAVQAVRRAAGGRLTPAAARRRPRARASELQVDQTLAEPPPDLGEQLGVVGDAPPQLHGERRATTGAGTWITTRVAPGRSRSTALTPPWQ